MSCVSGRSCYPPRVMFLHNLEPEFVSRGADLLRSYAGAYTCLDRGFVT
ncbi:MAG: hypothetical protein HY791_25370 [Deltaproteobacteria bacterium]|nr:hypothetical protein [Deltaproteobacteria bacterium]